MHHRKNRWAGKAKPAQRRPQRTRNAVYLAASSLCLSGLLAAPASAQSEAQQDAAPGVRPVSDEIIVTGTRVVNRTRLDSAAPVDVISAETLRERGTTEVATALAQTAPSINFPRSSANGGTDMIRPATLRGLSPDQALVLINGIRGHTSALLNINSTAGRGAAAVDLNTIPSVAIERVEVLRDGASAQYGSDAIAGVINLRLREARNGGGASITHGEYITHVPTARQSRNVRDGATTTISAWQGLGLGSEGFLTISGEYLKRNPTNRADLDPRLPVPAISSRYGDPEVEQGTGYLNAGVPVGGSFQLYGWLGYQYRDSETANYFRTTTDSGNVAAIYPEGFLPFIGIKSKDLSSALGLRGTAGGWSLDFNLSYGRNQLDFRSSAVNPTYGPQSPTRFYLGALIYDQAVAGADASREIPLGQGRLNIAVGAEYRREGFQIRAGQVESYERGPAGIADPSLQVGATGFVGFQPANEVDVHRDNVSVYADVEATFDIGLTLGVAARGERYSDFGTTGTGKLSLRYDVSEAFALRGTVSTGFRAPSLQQSWYTSTQTIGSTLNTMLETGLYPSTNPIAVALGGKELEPEKSTNLSAGAVFRSGAFSLTADAYRIRIRDQLALSENIQSTFSPQVADLLAPFGVQAARFFINGIKSTTYGADIVAEYRLESASAGRFDLSLAANFNHIELNEVPTTTAVLDPAPVLYGRQRILTFEEGAPRTKIVGAVNWSLNGFGATARVSYYGDVLLASVIEQYDVYTGNRAIIDLEARYRFGSGVSLAVGADNVLDNYPRAVPEALNPLGLTGFSYSSPFGFNGRFVYARLGLNW